MRMEKPANMPLEDVVVGHIYELGVMGHIDYLFRDENNSFFQDLKEMCYMEHNPGFQDIPGTPTFIEKMDITELHTKAAAFLDYSEKSTASGDDNDITAKLMEAGRMLDGTDSRKNVKESLNKAGTVSPHSNSLLHMGLTRHARRASIETSALDELDNAAAWRRTSAMSVIPKGEDPSGGDIAVPIHIHGHDPLSRSGHDLVARYPCHPQNCTSHNPPTNLPRADSRILFTHPAYKPAHTPPILHTRSHPLIIPTRTHIFLIIHTLPHIPFTNSAHISLLSYTSPLIGQSMSRNRLVVKYQVPCLHMGPPRLHYPTLPPVKVISPSVDIQSLL